MAKKPVLVVMAAGMGSLYGGLKQIDPVGSKGEAILDYSIYDAHQAGFDTVVIIIKEAIKNDFMETVGARLKNAPVEIRYAYQELTKLPEGYSIPEGRTKPFGTGHAVLCAKEAIDGAPFAVINADDYYGKSAFKTIYDALCKAEDTDKFDYCMVGYEVGKTVTENGSVARGVCYTDENGYLTEDTIVSLNMWGFTPSFLDEIEKGFAAFLDNAFKTNPLKGEYFLPFVVQTLLTENRATVKVETSADKWYGVTYAADKPVIVAALREKTAQGLYPDSLWG